MIRNTPEYKNFHARLARARGKAIAYRCVDCSFWAEEWSHIHDTDPNKYKNYEPRCRSCHAKYDLTEKIIKVLTRPGISNGRAVLNFEIASQIRIEYRNNTNITRKELGAKYGVSKSQIDRVLGNKVWREDADNSKVPL